MTFRAVAILSLLTLTACGNSELEVSTDENLTDDVLVGPDDAQVEGELAATQVVFVNFGGVRICDSGDDYGPGNRSYAISGHFGVNGCKDFAASSIDRATVLNHLRSYFNGYNITFTDSRPGGAYTQLVISPSGGPNHGVAALDCGNRNQSGMAFVYRTGDNFFTNIGGGNRAVGVAKAATHELGHSFGLGHLGTPSSPSPDHMDVHSGGSRFTVGRTTDSMNCVGGSGRTQDAPGMLAASLGRSGSSGGGGSTGGGGGSVALPPAPSGCGAIRPGQGLVQGRGVTSCDGRFNFVLQGDGNLVLYQGNRALWNTGTNGRDGYALWMQTDGNLVLYNRGGTAIWNSRTAGRANPYVAIQSDGNVVLYSGSTAAWSTGTCCR